MAAPEAPTGWQPIETAPRDGTVVDLWLLASDSRHGKRIADARWDNNRSFKGGFARVVQPDAWVYKDGGGLIYHDGGRFTHWQPLPAPPEQGA